jgi:hypothetical protein
MDLSKLGRTEQVLSGAGVLLFIFSFLPWFEVTEDGITLHADAWSWPSGFNDWFPVLLLFFYAIVLALPAFGAVVRVPVLQAATNRALIGLALSAFAVLLIGLQGLTYPGGGFGYSAGPAWGYFISLIIVVTAVVQSYLGFTRQGGSFARIGAALQGQGHGQEQGQGYRQGQGYGQGQKQGYGQGSTAAHPEAPTQPFYQQGYQAGPQGQYQSPYPGAPGQPYQPTNQAPGQVPGQVPGQPPFGVYPLPNSPYQPPAGQQPYPRSQGQAPYPGPQQQPPPPTYPDTAAQPQPQPQQGYGQGAGQGQGPYAGAAPQPQQEQGPYPGAAPQNERE